MDLTVAQLYNAISAARHAPAMGGQQQGRVLAAQQIQQQLQDAIASFLVQIAGRLVGKHHIGSRGQGPDDRDPLLLPSRESIREAARALSQADLLQQT